MELILIIISAVFINNLILSQFLGICPFLGVSKKSSAALGMGGAVVVIIFIASIITYLVYFLVLVPLKITYLDTITFILIIASIVQVLEMLMKKVAPGLYKALGVYLPLITTNCAVLGTALYNIATFTSDGKMARIPEMLVYSLAAPLGFALVLFLFSTITTGSTTISSVF